MHKQIQCQENKLIEALHIFCGIIALNLVLENQNKKDKKTEKTYEGKE